MGIFLVTNEEIENLDGRLRILEGTLQQLIEELKNKEKHKEEKK